MKNVALATNGGVASASSEYSLDVGYEVEQVNDGERSDQWLSEAGATAPQWVQVEFQRSRCTNVDVYFGLFGGAYGPIAMRDFTVQWWDGEDWQVAGTVVDNEDDHRTFAVDFITTKVRVHCTEAGAGDLFRCAEIEVQGEEPLPEGWVRVSDNWACRASELTEAPR